MGGHNWLYIAPPTIGPGSLVQHAAASIEAEHNTTETVISALSHDFSNKVQFTVFDTNGVEDGATPDHTNDHITIITPGTYYLVAHVGLFGGTNTVVSFAIFKNNGATQVIPRTTRKISTTGDVGAASSGGLAVLAAGDTMEVWVQNETNTDNVTIHDISFALYKVT